MSFNSDDTLHQNPRLVPPRTVVCSTDCWLCPIGPLCAASTPSCDTLLCPNQVFPPAAVHTRFVLSSAGPTSAEGAVVELELLELVLVVLLLVVEVVELVLLDELLVVELLELVLVVLVVLLLVVLVLLVELVVLVLVVLLVEVVLVDVVVFKSVGPDMTTAYGCGPEGTLNPEIVTV